MDTYVIERECLTVGGLMDTRILTAQLPAHLVDKLDRLAAERGSSPETLLENLLAQWLEDEEEDHRLTLQGLQDVRNGRTVSHAAVRDWANSLGTDNPLPPPVPD